MSEETKVETVAPAASAEVTPAAPPTHEPPPAEEPVQSPKERIMEIADALHRASPSGVETLAGELAALAASL